MSQQSHDASSANNFLQDVLRVIRESNGDAEVVYPLFDANTHLLNDNLPDILRDWATDVFEQGQSEEAESTATDIIYFGNRILEFPRGSKASNVEIAIACYETVLKLYTRQAFPYEWAMTQMNLGNAYGDRIKGDKADNIEQAIIAYQQALEVRTREALPYEWAKTQMNLGIAYKDRIKGDKADNIELAIIAYQQALEVTTRQAFPYYWAMTQMNLGIAYRNRIKGDKADNIELAIIAYQQALEVYTREALPYEWAMTQMNLGNAYGDRIKGDKADNIELAIIAYQQALEVRTRQAFPQDWAMTQMNLGIAYWSRIKGDKADNIEQAIIAYQQALQVTTRKASPYYWAMTQNNLGLAYGDRIKGDKADNIEQAIIAYQQALEVYTREALPYEWAMTQMNLGIAYWSRIKGDKADNIEQAIIAYQQALEVRTREASPEKYANTSLSLGIAYQDNNRFNDAYNSYDSAIATVELLRGEIISGEESKRKQAEQWNQLYRRMVEVCLQLGEDTEAVEYIERSKTRNLVELLLKDEVNPKGETSPEDNQRLQQLRDEIAVERQRLQEAEINNRNSQQEPETLSMIPRLSQGTRITQLRKEREELISRIIGFKAIGYSEIQQLLDENTAIIQWYLFKDCFRAFVITRDRNKPQIWCSSAEDFQKLEEYWNSKYFNSYRQDKKHWIYELNDKLQQLPEILHLDEVISLVPQSCKKLILVPHRYLHLLPIHGLQLSNGEYLIDKFSHGVTAAPSCQLLKILKKQSLKCRDVIYNVSSNSVSTLFGIQNPTNNLEFSDIEVETIATKFQPNYILKHNEATLTAFQQQSNSDNFKNAHWLHFSSHGYFDLDNPYKSALELHGAAKVATSDVTESSRTLRISEEEAIELEKCLTLENIFELTLSNCRLVTLSACESGYTDFNNTSDEYIGLPSGFIHAGAASIVSTLWAVDDFSTAILTIKFYENIQNSTSTNNISIALNQAQNWFRQITTQELRQWIDRNQNMTADNKLKITQRLAQYKDPQEKLFEKPYYWAGFYAIGD
jgi:CHAT domain-containing protein